MKTHILALALIVLSLPTFAQSLPAPWSYHAPNGPFQWGSNPNYNLCQVGADQSPVDIEDGLNAGMANTTEDSGLPSLEPEWRDSSFKVINNGHTIQMVYDAGSVLNFNNEPYELKQFHFHSPSEHILDGRQYPLEAHFVHQVNGKTLVVGVFFEEGPASSLLDQIWQFAPAAEVASPISVDGLTANANDLLPQDLSYFNYTGSLTTPPCSEGVTWIVLKKPMTATRAELKFLQSRMGGPNNRPIQPQDGRLIGTSTL